MKIIINNLYQPYLDGSSISISRAMSDPIPTCALTLRDNNSSIYVSEVSEIIVIDDQVYPNPTLNTASNPSMDPYTLNWNPVTITGIALSTVVGGGIKFTMSNAAVQNSRVLASDGALISTVIPGQQYVASVYIVESGLTNTQATLSISWYDGGYNAISENKTAFSVTAVNTRYSVTATAPVGSVIMQINFGVNVTNATNTGTITWTQAQLEPLWFPTLNYPTPYCGPNQTNCVQLPSQQWIRQYRKFAGFVNHVTYGNYHGNVRDVQIHAVGYSWLMSTVIVNNAYTNHHGDHIFDDLCSTYLRTSPNFVFGNAALFNTTTGATSNIQQGVNFASIQANWDDIRTMFDNVSASNGWYWTVDFYWNVIFVPPGFFSMPIGLICDNSSNPDMVNTYPAYDFSAEMDFTQPGSTALVLGGQVAGDTQSALIINPTTAANYGFLPQYTFMRKVNESYLFDSNDCAQRGNAELLLYGSPRWIYHLKTNVELIAGEGIQVTSNTEGLNASVLLIQSVTATWLGTNEALDDVWEYQANLGATNHAAINIMSRIFRTTQQNKSAPSIHVTSLLTFESVNVDDSIDSNSVYALSVLSDSPLRYYRLGEPAGFSITSAYDWSGNAATGTITGPVTLGTSGLIYNDTNTAMTFDGSTGYIASISTSGLPTGAGTWTVECWFKATTVSGFHCLVAMGSTGAANAGMELAINSGQVCVTNSVSPQTSSSASISAGTVYYAAATYNGSTITLYLYANGVSLSINTFGYAYNLSYGGGLAQLANDWYGDFYNGVLDECAIYGTALSSSRIAAHAHAGFGR